MALGAPVFTEESGPAVDEKTLADTAGRGEEALLRFTNTPWTGDLDGMLERGLIRVLVVHSKTYDFTEKGKGLRGSIILETAF